MKEALGILGAFGTLFSVMQICSLEWRRFVNVTRTSLMALHTLGFQMRLFGMLVLTIFFISKGDAENLSLLTSDTYGVAWVDVQSTVELILVMKLPAEQTRRLSWRLGLASAFDGGPRLLWRDSGQFARALVLVGLGHGLVLLRGSARRDPSGVT